MRQLVIFHTMLWLDTNNILYKDIIIYHQKMSNWEDEFVFKSIDDNIVLSASDYSNHKGYMHNLSRNNLENDMYIVISESNKLQSGLISRYVFTNIDRIRHHLFLKLISVVYNLTNSNIKTTKPFIIYNTNSHPISLNNLKDKHYFKRLFSTLFLYRDSQYLTKQKIVISLQTWEKWTREYHSHW